MKKHLINIKHKELKLISCSKLFAHPLDNLYLIYGKHLNDAYKDPYVNLHFHNHVMVVSVSMNADSTPYMFPISIDFFKYPDEPEITDHCLKINEAELRRVRFYSSDTKNTKSNMCIFEFRSGQGLLILSEESDVQSVPMLILKFFDNHNVDVIEKQFLHQALLKNEYNLSELFTTYDNS